MDENKNQCKNRPLHSVDTTSEQRAQALQMTAEGLALRAIVRLSL